MKIAILGAGVSGLTAGRLLKEAGHDVTVYEKESTAGGLARTRYTAGYLYDPYGGHIFNSKEKSVVDWVFSIMPREKWQYTDRNAKIYFNGRYVSYPFELSLCELDTEDAVDCIHDFILSQNGEEPDNFREWLYWNFGRGIADRYMVPYNEKIWAYPLEEMETRWMQGKMPLPTKKEMIRSMLLKDPTERKMPHSSFYYPIDGGIQSMVDAIADGLKIMLSTPVESIERAEGGNRWRINGLDEYDSVISTIPLPVVGKVHKGLTPAVEQAIKGLKYNSLNTVLFKCPKTDITWLYIPSHEYRAHRVGYQSTLTPNACPDQMNHGCGALEIIGNRITDVEALVKDHALPEELGFKEPIDSEFTEFAYVVHDMDYRKNTGTILRYFEMQKNFHLLGRWGTWNYKNMDLCMKDAMDLVEKKFGGQEEKLCG